MQGIENKTQLAGTIVSRKPHPELAEYDVLGVRVEDAKPVEGVADLLSSTVGTELAVTVRRPLLDDSAQRGASIRFRAERTPEGAMADTYPEAGVFEIVDAGAGGLQTAGPHRPQMGGADTGLGGALGQHRRDAKGPGAPPDSP